jgi:hypothetical protein
LAVGHHAREFQGFGDPAPIVLAVQLDGKVHIVIVQQGPGEKPTLRSVGQARGLSYSYLRASMGLMRLAFTAG